IFELFYFFFQAEDGIRDYKVTGVQTCALPIYCCHKGGRLAFGPDGKLYVTLGDEHASAAAQNTGDVRGKILRYNPDGTAPSDNQIGRASCRERVESAVGDEQVKDTAHARDCRC